MEQLGTFPNGQNVQLGTHLGKDKFRRGENMIYTEKVKTALKDIGKDNKIKNRAILEILENVASYHSDLVGYGANDIGKTKLSWVLLDWKLEV